MLNGHQEALRWYMHKSVRRSDRKIAESSSVEERRVDSSAKMHATYSLGLLSFDDGKYEVAANWFKHEDLNAKASPVRSGAQYNLARSLEAQDQVKEAIPLLESSGSPQQHGDKLRARELKSQPTKEPAEKPGK